MFRIQEELKDCNLIAFPAVWLTRLNEVATVKVYDGSKTHYDGPIESDQFRQIERALARKGIVRKECEECGLIAWRDSSWAWNGFCSDECQNKCYSRDLRHQERTFPRTDEHIPLFITAKASGFRCAICGGRMEHLWMEDDGNFLYHSIDHIIPVVKGGLHTRSNVQAVHLICNETKGAGPQMKISLHAEDLYDKDIKVRYDKDAFIAELRRHRVFA